jgi:hypothetical protein
MKAISRTLLLSTVAFLATASSSCRGEESKSGTAANPTSPMKVRLGIGEKTFRATLEDSETAKAFAAMLPLTLKMADLHRNEKFHRFQKNLPTQDANPGTIRGGDLMIWSSNTLVLFYEDFRTSHSYTRLGRLDNPAGLSEALGSADVQVTFEKIP